MFKLDPQESSLQSIHSRVSAQHEVLVLVQPTVIGKHTAPCSELSVVGSDRSCISHCAEILGGVEAEATHVAQRTNAAISVSRTGRVGAIFDHIKASTSSQVAYFIHLGREAIEMNRNYSLCFSCY